MPSSDSASTAGWLARDPLGALTPAERMVISVRSRRKWRMSLSAMGLRQTFPVQTKRMVLRGFEDPLSCWDDIRDRIVSASLKSIRLNGGDDGI